MPGTNGHQPDILVVGGGAAGILAARRAAECGARVTLLEKNPRLGMKILISGGGKCNLTHAGPMEEIRTKFRPNEARFLKPAFYQVLQRRFPRASFTSAAWRLMRVLTGGFSLSSPPTPETWSRF